MSDDVWETIRPQKVPQKLLLLQDYGSGDGRLQELSSESRLVLDYLEGLGLPKDCSVTHIAAHTKLAEEIVKASLWELESAGFIRWVLRLNVPIDASAETFGCPVCGVECTHMESPLIYPGDDYQSPFENRGTSLVIPFWCENGWHKWLLSFNFHKGVTDCRIELDTPVARALLNAIPLAPKEKGLLDGIPTS